MDHRIKVTVSRFCLINAILIATIGCDQAAKLVVRDTLTITGPISYLNDNVRLEYARNPGAFLSFGADLPEATRFWIFNVAVALFLTYLAWQLFTAKQIRPFGLVGFTLILGGGLGNLIDRIAFGSVTDFLMLGIGSWKTGIFNFADVAIVLGVTLLTLNQHRHRKQAS
ncbi:MAG: signal peptidase II [Bdellovibrionales bacterium]